MEHDILFRHSNCRRKADIYQNQLEKWSGIEMLENSWNSLRNIENAV